MTEAIQTSPNSQSLGALRSEMSFTIHSQYTARLWHGRGFERDKSDKIVQYAIPGMPHCMGVLNRVQRDSIANDPFADVFLIEVEEKIQSANQRIKEMITSVVDMYADKLPDGLDIQGALNVNPLIYPVQASSQMSFKLLYLLADFDLLARSVQTASHIALMTNTEAYEWLMNGSKVVRQCFGLIQRYRSSGVSRQDVLDNNQRYQEAVKRFGALPVEVLRGEKRAEFAPNVRGGIPLDSFDKELEALAVDAELQDLTND